MGLYRTTKGWHLDERPSTATAMSDTDNAQRLNSTKRVCVAYKSKSRFPRILKPAAKASGNDVLPHPLHSSKDVGGETAGCTSRTPRPQKAARRPFPLADYFKTRALPCASNFLSSDWNCR